MEKYKDESGRLTLAARKLIQERLEQGRSIRSFYQELGIHRKTVTNEISRNIVNGRYDANEANERSLQAIKYRPYYTQRSYEKRFEKIEEEIESLKIFMKNISDLLEELYNRPV